MPGPFFSPGSALVRTEHFNPLRKLYYSKSYSYQQVAGPLKGQSHLNWQMTYMQCTKYDFKWWHAVKIYNQTSHSEPYPIVSQSIPHKHVGFKQHNTWAQLTVWVELCLVVQSLARSRAGICWMTGMSRLLRKPGLELAQQTISADPSLPLHPTGHAVREARVYGQVHGDRRWRVQPGRGISGGRGGDRGDVEVTGFRRVDQNPRWAVSASISSVSWKPHIFDHSQQMFHFDISLRPISPPFIFLACDCVCGNAFDRVTWACVPSGCSWVGFNEPEFEGRQFLLEEGEYPESREWGGYGDTLLSLRPVLSVSTTQHMYTSVSVRFA